MGVAQREKERTAAAIAAGAAPSGVGATALAQPTATVVDPDPSFSALFTSTLEAECFVSVQIESAYEDNRDSDAHMQRFARNLAEALCTFTEWHVLADGEAWPSTRKQG
jgi:thioesterase domain-containing protein